MNRPANCLHLLSYNWIIIICRSCLVRGQLLKAHSSIRFMCLYVDGLFSHTGLSGGFPQRPIQTDKNIFQVSSSSSKGCYYHSSASPTTSHETTTPQQLVPRNWTPAAHVSPSMNHSLTSHPGTPVEPWLMRCDESNVQTW